jgi:hypothetical protein
MRIIVIGADGVGKSAAASVIAKELRCGYCETGNVLIKKLAEFYAAASYCPNEVREMWKRTIRRCKSEFRRELHALGSVLTKSTPSLLVDEAARHGRMIVGIRRECEAEAVIERYGRENTIWIHIDRPGANDDGFELSRWPVDFRVSNSGDSLSFLRNIRQLAKIIRHHFVQQHQFAS